MTGMQPAMHHNHEVPPRGFTAGQDRWERARRRFRGVAKGVTPPFIASLLRHRPRQEPEWTFAGHGWPDLAGRGWETPEIARTQAGRLPGFAAMVQSPGPLGVSPEAPTDASQQLAAQNTYMCFAYACAVAARQRPSLSVLDWGGGLGQYSLLLRALFPDLEVDYLCKDHSSFVDIGPGVNPGVRFTADAALATGGRYDLVIASSSMHYSQDWRGLMMALAKASAPWFLLTRQPIVQHAASYVVVQRAHRHGYPSEYPGWVLNREELLDAARDACLLLRREFLIGEQPTIPGAPEQPEYRGFLFRSDGDAHER